MNFSNSNLPTSVAIVFGFLLMLLLPFDKVFAIFNLGDYQEDGLGDILSNIVIICYGYFLIRRFGYPKVSGVTNLKPKYPILLVIPLYFIILNLLQYVLLGYEFNHIKFIDVVILLGSMMTVGFSEEIIFRGFVLPNLIKGITSDQSLFAPIFMGAMLFGVLHLLNLFQSDSHLWIVLSQVTYATTFGIAFGIVLLRSASLLPLAILHGLINFSSNLANLPGAVEPPEVAEYKVYEGIIAVIVVLPFFSYSLYQFPKIDRSTILNLYEPSPK